VKCYVKKSAENAPPKKIKKIKIWQHEGVELAELNIITTT
jgi:hypothetical protein